MRPARAVQLAWALGLAGQLARAVRVPASDAHTGAGVEERGAESQLQEDDDDPVEKGPDADTKGLVDGVGAAMYEDRTSSTASCPLDWLQQNRGVKDTGLAPQLLDAVRRSSEAGLKVWYFLGDSTVRVQWQGLCSILSPTSDIPLVRFCASPQTHEECEKTYYVCGNSTFQAVFRWAFFFETTVSLADDIVKQKMATPKVIYMGSGLHGLHLVPANTYRKRQAESWLNYEASIQAAVRTHRKTFPKVRILLMTPHAICERAYFGEFATVLKKVRHNLTDALQPCQAALLLEGLDSMNAQLACHGALALDVASTGLNSRMAAAVGALRWPVKLVDTHSITAGRCDVADDSFHYNVLYTLELQALFQAAGMLPGPGKRA